MNEEEAIQRVNVLTTELQKIVKALTIIDKELQVTIDAREGENLLAREEQIMKRENEILEELNKLLKFLSEG